MKFSGMVGHAASEVLKNHLDFVGNPDSFVNPGSYFQVLQHYKIKHKLTYYWPMIHRAR